MSDAPSPPTSPTTHATLMTRAAARQKSYVGPSIFVFVMYLLFWLPGFIANIFFLLHARRNEQIAQQSLPGTGCLRSMLIVGVILALVVVAAAYYLMKARGLFP